MSGNQDSPDNTPKKQGYSTIILIIVLAVVYFGYKTVNHGEPSTIPDIPLSQAEAQNPEPPSPQDGQKPAAAPQDKPSDTTDQSAAASETKTPSEPEDEVKSVETAPAEESENAEEDKDQAASAPQEEQEQQAATPAPDSPPVLDIEKLAKPHSMGNPDAPLKITEYASFTCPHCAAFHKTSFQKIQEEYIDTGKIYLTFSDFPTNLPAVQASKVARCVPEQNYFNFVHLLFETQNDWAHGSDYQTRLKQDALIAGLDSKTFDACINSEDLQKAILSAVEAANKEKGVDSVPTMILSDGEKIAGNLPYEEIKKILDAGLAQAEKK
ncbi:MAG: thioredoxin domain-containing protein [Rhodospirillales bacterium]|nr:thioredoxin domain-containing protein [Alphaproteobacteria bacterium]MCB1841111.1 thioredoxin domain-containing protein [Alphaproteobacteria bacterium]MCB9977371.1 thioredoxin domain-containing protein [Rhodospirillales bacterium]